MANRENMGTNIDSGIVSAIAAGVRFAVAGITPSSWMSPGQPLQPIAQDEAKGRALDYPVGFNQRTRPRQGEELSFNDLRALADSYDLLRIIIETRKDQVESFEWEIVPTDKKDKNKFQEEIKQITTFLEQPSLEHDWPTWIRAMLEDLFVLDAVAISPRSTKGGQLLSLDLIDAGLIKRVIDDTGRTPLPPSPAYQQILKGVPAVDYSSDELIYWMRNPRTNRLYGYGPVEQIIMTVNIALRRQVSQLQYYTEGNVPEALASVPEQWTPEQVAQFQGWFDSLLEGNTAQRRKMKFLPMDANKVKLLREPELKDMYDEWLARVCCFAFSISPTPFIKENNRATADSQAETAKEQGLMPLLQFLERRMNTLLHRCGVPTSLSFRWKMTQTIDPKSQAEIHDKYIRSGTISIDEAREDLGKEPLGIPNMVFTATGPAPLNSFTVLYNEDGSLVDPPEPEPTATPGEDPNAMKDPNTENSDKSTPEGEEEPVTKVIQSLLEKVSSPEIYVHVEQPKLPGITINTVDSSIDIKETQ